MMAAVGLCLALVGLYMGYQVRHLWRRLYSFHLFLAMHWLKYQLADDRSEIKHLP